MENVLGDYNANLQKQKNIGYAWRQLVFHLSMIPEEQAQRLEVNNFHYKLNID